MGKPLSYAQITPLDPEWLWKGKIPFGAVTGIGGQGGIGKGLLMADLAARVSRGDVMPDGTPGPSAGSVVMVTTEDDPNTAESYRLMAAHADMSNVYDMTSINGGMFSLPESLPALREAVYDIGDVRIIIIDPLADVASISLSSNAVAIRAKITNPMTQLARDTGVAFGLMMHTTKDGKTLAGSAGIMQALRSLLRVERDHTNPSVRVLSVAKSNIADDSTASNVRYTLEGSGRDIHVKYLGTESDTAEDVVWAEYTDEELTAGWSREAGQSGIMAALRAAYPDTMRAGELAKESGTDYISTRVLLRKLERRGEVTEPESGEWTLGEESEPDTEPDTAVQTG